MANRFLNNVTINDSYTLPSADGTENQIIVTDGAGNLSFNDLGTITGAITGVESNLTYYEVKNSSGAQILKGKGVMAVGTDGNSGHILIDEMVADGSVEARYFLGVLSENLDNGSIGRVIAFGELDQFNTTGQNGETWTGGQVLWCDPDSAGDFTTTEPDGPNVKIPAAFILKASTNGKIQIRVQANEGIHTLHDTKITTQADGELLVWNNTLGVWQNDGTATVDYTNGRVGVGTTSPDAIFEVKTLDSNRYVRFKAPNGEERFQFYTGGTGNPAAQFMYDADGTTRTVQINASGASYFNGGNVGIGTTSPAVRLDYGSTVNQAFHLYTNGADYYGINMTQYDSGPYSTNIFSGNGGQIKFRTASGTSTQSTRMTITQTGNVGIGTTSPSYKLDVDAGGNQGAVNSRLAQNYGRARFHGVDILGYDDEIMWIIGNNSSTTTELVLGNTWNWDQSVSFRYTPNTTGSAAGGLQIGQLSKNNANWTHGHTAFYTNGSERMRIDSSGSLKLNNYGSGTFTGTATQRLAVDSSGNVIEIPIGSGPVDGSGTANYVTKWSDADTITNSVIYDDGTNVGIGTTSPQDRLHVKNDDASGGNSRCDIRLENGSSYAEFGVLSGYARIQAATYEVGALSRGASYFYTDTAVFGAHLSTGTGDGKLVINGSSGTGGEAYLSLSRNNVSDFILNNNGNGIQVRATSNMPMYFYTNDTIRQTISASGNVGIGETSIDARLHITTATAGLVNQKFESAGSAAWRVGIPASQTYFAFDNANDNLSAPKVVINASGNVGIGVTNPLQKLEVNGHILLQNNNEIRFKDTGGTQRTAMSLDTSNNLNIGTSAGGALKFINGSSYTERMRIDSDGNVGIGTTSPGGKLDVAGTITARPGSSSNSAFSVGVLEITSSSTPTQIKITTNIPYSGAGATTHAHNVTIRGFQYGNANTVDLQISWHVYNNSFYNRAITSSGGWAPTVRLAVENNKVVIHLASPGYWPKMYVESLYNAYGSSAHAQGWSWSDAAISADANTPNELVPYKINFGNSFLMDSNGNVGIGTTSPSYKLDVNGTFRSAGIVDAANANAIFINGNEEVGIGTTSPLQKLHVAGNIRVTGAYYDSNNSAGTSGQVLSSTATGTDWVSLSEISGVDGSGTANYVTKWSDADTIGNSIIYDDGTNVGIGTTSPATNLHVKTTSNAQGITIQRASTTAGAYGQLSFLASTSDSATPNVYLRGYRGATFDDNYLTVSTNSTERMRVTNDGNVGIGTTNPAHKLVVSNGGAQGLEFNAIGGVGNDAFIQSYNRSTSSYENLTYYANDHYFNYGVNTRMIIQASGNVGIGTTNPSVKLDVRGLASIGTATPKSDWYTTAFYGLEINGGGSLWGRATDTHLSSNYYVKATPSPQDTYMTTNEAIDLWMNNGTGDLSIRMAASGTAGTAITWTTPFIIKNNGNVGIGETNPSYKLSVSTNGDTYSADFYQANSGTDKYNAIRVRGAMTSAVGYYGIGGSATGNTSFRDSFVIGTQTAHNFNLATNDTARMTITSGGNVGIGVTNPVQTLEIHNSDASGYTHFGIKGTGHKYVIGVGNDSVSTVNDKLYFYDNDNSAFRVVLDTSGNVGIGTTSPDAKLEVAGGSTGIILSNLGNSAAYDAVSITYSGYNSGTPEFVFQPKTAPGSGTVNSWFRFKTQGSVGQNIANVTVDGNVGIGTDSPVDKLDVNGNLSIYGNKIYNGAASNSAGLDFGGSYANLSGYYGIRFYSSTAAIGSMSERMRITNAGNVGIGNTTPQDKLDVTGVINSSNNIVSNATYTMFTGRSNRTVNDYGGLNKQYFKLNLVTPGPNTTGEASAHGFGDLRFQLANNAGSTAVADIMTLRYNGNVGIGTTIPKSKLQVNGGVQMADDTDTASADKVGTLRYRADANNSYVDMCMQTGASTYEWINIVQNNW